MNLSVRSPNFPRLHRKLRILSATILVCAAIAWAGDTPWKSKPYQQWDDNDIHRILTDSPWVHVVSVSATWRTPGDPTTQGLPAGSVPPAGNSAGSQPATRGNSMQDAAVGSDRAEYPLEPFYVYWLSSKTVQEALAQRAVLHLGETPAEAEKRANQPEPDYAVLVQGTDMTPFLHSDEKFFLANASLKLKKAGQELVPLRVEFRRDAGGKTIVGAIFYFPKTSAAGQPLILPGEKNIEFTCKIGTSTLKSNFDPQKMVARSGPDL